MKAMTLNEIVVNAQAAAFSQMCNGGYIRIKDADGVTLAEMRFGDPAFGDPLNGVLKVVDIKGERSAPATGTAHHYEVYARDGVKLLTGSVGLTGSDAEMELPYLEIREGMGIYISSFTHRVPRGN